MQIKVNQVKSEPDKLKVFIEAFEMGQEAARKVYEA